jgi:anti-sigma B factor antagonist
MTFPSSNGSAGDASRPLGGLQVELDQLDSERVCVRVAGELDLATAEGLSSRLAEILTRARTVVLDLGELQFMDSTGLAAIITALRQASDNGAELAIASPLPPQPQRLLELTGVVERLSFTPTPPRPPA